MGADLAGLCENVDEIWPEGEFDNISAVPESTGPEEMSGQPTSEISDTETRAWVEQLTSQARGFLRAMRSYCHLRAENTLPEHGLEFPEHGELVIFGDYRARPGMRKEYDAAFEPALCEKPFDLVIQVSGDDQESSHLRVSLAYTFCERDGDFQLIRAYRNKGSSDGPWERFDDLR